MERRGRTRVGSDFVRKIEEEFVVLDGAFGTLLQERGHTPDQLPEEWNILRPDVVRDIYLEYLVAGAQIITTNTFGASPLKLGMRGKEHLTEEANRRGVQLVREALEMYRADVGVPARIAAEYRFIAGSVGPCGKMLGMDLDEDDARRSIAAQAAVLAAEGVDLFMVETMMDLNEAELVVRTLKAEVDKPVVASMVFNRTKNDFRTLFGNTVEESVLRLSEAGADSVGTNCGLIEDYIPVIRQMRALTDNPLVLYPNAGLPKLKGGATVFETTPEELLNSLDASIDAGASILGGCCGTTPEYIRLLSDHIKYRKRRE
jgi:5-methyltetrahydrofolate--homocysteine methyltransferase